jgi:Carboxypeptidase regulatory-like domain/TonB dependent receptor
VRLRFRLPLFLLVVLFAGAAVGQSPNGTISGLVLDPSGRAITGADVLIVNDATGIKYPGATNGEGIYAVPSLPPGPYRIQISKIGFKTLIKPDVVLNVQSAVAINFTLPVGAVAETLTVEGGAPLVNTQSAAVSTVVDGTYVQNMPLNGRSFQDLILLTPGTATQNPQVGNESTNASLGSSGEFSVNGQRPESNYYTVDGVSGNLGASSGIAFVQGAGPSGSVPSATALGTTQAMVSVDDLQEFRVQSSTYSAEYGRNPGGQFAFETKSGTSQWHGTAYDYLRNGFFDAPDWFNDYLGLAEPALRQNDFGGTLGGPLVIPRVYQGNDKTFFFVSYEGLRLAQPQAATVNYVPDSSLRASAPPPLNRVLNAFPIPNGQDVGNGIAQFVGSWSNPSSLDSTSIRLDHVVRDHLKLFFRFSDTPSKATTRETGSAATPTELNSTAYTSRTYTAGASSMLTNRVSNEFRVNYSSNQVTGSWMIDGFGGSTPADLAVLAGLPSGAAVGIDLLYGGYVVSVEQFRESGAQKQWNFIDSVALSLGRHQLIIGGDYRRLTPSATPFNPQNIYYYLSETDVQSNSALAIAASLFPAHPLYENFSAFAQDEWRVSPRVTLSLGLRWEVNPAPGVTEGLAPYTVSGSGPSTWTLAPPGSPLWRTTWHNLAPRLGVAYAMHESSSYETVLRGGAGIFYDTGQQLGSQGFQGPGFFALNFFFTPISFPLDPALSSPPVANPPVAPYNAPVYAFSPRLQLPYTIQWNASLEQGLRKSQALTVSYVGAHSTKVLQDNEISGSAVGNPNVPDGFVIVSNGRTSDYNALQMQFRRRLSQGLTALASYTLSHCSDYGSQNYFFAYQRGNCDFDVRHNFSAAFSSELPSVGRNRFMRAVLDHWGFDGRFTARTGFPVTLNGGTVIDPGTGQSFHSGLDMVPGQAVYIYGAQCAAVYNNGLRCPGGRAINPNAFASPPTGQLGDAPRNLARGFGAVQMDVAIRREIPISGRLKLQFRAEAFNVFNHPNFGSVNAHFGQATFGQVTGTLASTLGILSPLYQMGGPRSMQFALKLTF